MLGGALAAFLLLVALRKIKGAYRPIKPFLTTAAGVVEVSLQGGSTSSSRAYVTASARSTGRT